MRLERHRRIHALAICAMVATLALAAHTYDFTGHWTGSATVDGAMIPLSADLTSPPSSSKFTGMLVVTAGAPCTVKGKLTTKVKIHLKCDDGSKIKVTGQLDTSATPTITGSFTRTKHGKRKTGGTLTLTKTS